jgi:AIPR protein
MTSSFENKMRSAVAALARRLNVDEDKAFTIWYATMALHLGDDEAIEATSYDGGNDRGIDLFHVDDEWDRVVIGQSRYYKSSTKSPRPADVTYLFNTIEELQDPQELRDAGRPDLADAAEDLLDARLRGFTVVLQLVYPGKQNDDLDRLVRQFNRKNVRENMGAAIVRLDDLQLLYEDYVGMARRVPEGELILTDGNFFEDSDASYGRSLVGTIRGSSLQALYEKHGNRLFDQNVRLFLGARKGGVNAGIRDTVSDPAERTNFWAYNNGITIVATDFDIDPKTHVVKMEGFSIVNGCQTTVSIAEASPTAAGEVQVLGRVVAARPELVDSIIRYTNSQNPIAVWDISARDKVQQRLKRELEELKPPWFYALRRGEFENLADKDAFGKGAERRVLPFPLAAQYVAAVRGLPVEAYKDKARLFTTHKDRVFPADIAASELLWAWALGQAAERAIVGYKSSVEVDDVAEAVLKRGARFFVTAVAAFLLRLRNGEDAFAKVDASRVQDKAMVERLDRYALVAVLYYVSIMRSMIGAGADLGTLLKTTETTATIENRRTGPGRTSVSSQSAFHRSCSTRRGPSTSP